MCQAQVKLKLGLRFRMRLRLRLVEVEVQETNSLLFQGWEGGWCGRMENKANLSQVEVEDEVEDELGNSMISK